MSQNWVKIENPQSREAHIFLLDEVKIASKARWRIRILFKNGGTILICGRGKWFEEAWAQLTVKTIGVPIYSYWDRQRKAK